MKTRKKPTGKPRASAASQAADNDKQKDNITHDLKAALALREEYAALPVDLPWHCNASDDMLARLSL